MQAFAATIRDETGRVVRTTDGGTVCWSPRRPSRFMAEDPQSGDAVVLRCGDCCGCREFERRRLVARLRQLYAKERKSLWLLSAECCPSLVSRLVARANRTVTTSHAGNFFRLGNDGVALIVAGPKPIGLVRIGSTTVRLRVSAIKNPWRGRAWREATKGLKVPRSEYGKSTKRYYHRGLPKAERQNWQVSTRGGIRAKRDSVYEGVRAYRNGCGLYPPEAWILPRRLRTKGPEAKRWAQSLASIESVISASATAFKRPSEGGDSRENSRIAWLLERAREDSKRRRASGHAAKDTGVPSKGRGYKTSLPLDDKELGQWVARMVALAKQRGDTS